MLIHWNITLYELESGKVQAGYVEAGSCKQNQWVIIGAQPALPRPEAA